VSPGSKGQAAAGLAGLAGLAVRLAAAAVWIVAGAAKAPDLQAFRATVESYAILPGAIAGPFAYVLPFLEMGLGLYLALGLFVRGTALAGTLLFAVFLAAQVSALVRGIPLGCGCFGPASESTIGAGTIIRDAALGLPTFAMLAFPARLLSLDRRLFGLEDRFAFSPQPPRPLPGPPAGRAPSR
jgi:uncharacterized membrane protein YphA (DoxX/SURF4 family)